MLNLRYLTLVAGPMLGSVAFCATDALSKAGCNMECAAPSIEWNRPNEVNTLSVAKKCEDNSSYRHAVANCFACMDKNNGWRFFTSWDDLDWPMIQGLAYCNGLQ